jgi:hypothetical protein
MVSALEAGEHLPASPAVPLRLAHCAGYPSAEQGSAMKPGIPVANPARTFRSIQGLHNFPHAHRFRAGSR